MIIEVTREQLAKIMTVSPDGWITIELALSEENVEAIKEEIDDLELKRVLH